MYAWIWHHLPFGRPGRWLGSALLVGLAVALLWYVVFPWAEPLLPFDDVQVTDSEGVPGGGDPGGDPGVGPGPDDPLPYPTDRNNPPPSSSPRR